MIPYAIVQQPPNLFLVLGFLMLLPSPLNLWPKRPTLALDVYWAGIFIILAATQSLLWCLVLPFGLRLYLKWILGQTTDEERRAGMAGVRAWLSPLNIVWALGISYFSSQAYHTNFAGILALTILLLLAYPLVTNFIWVPPASKPPLEDLSAEREKVIQLLEQGKITANESVELFNALSGSTRLDNPPAATFASQRLIWLGTCLVFLGFFLPWFAINPGEELTRLTSQMQMNQPESAGIPQLPANMLEGVQLNTPLIHITGPEVRFGLGWMLLFLSIAASTLPLVAPKWDKKKQTLSILAALGLGTIVSMVVVAQNLHYARLGAGLCLAGYAISFFGSLREWKVISASNFAHQPLNF